MLLQDAKVKEEKDPKAKTKEADTKGKTKGVHHQHQRAVCVLFITWS